MSPQVILLNGASSSGKSTLARALHNYLPGLWLVFGIDDLIRALPARLTSPDGIEFAEDGGVQIGPAFRVAEAAWMQGVAATARAGVNVIIDDVLLGGGAGQERWRHVLEGLPTLWVGVTCTLEAGEARELARPERVAGMHRQQAGLVHQGMEYDLTVDTTSQSPERLAEAVAQYLSRN